VLDDLDYDDSGAPAIGLVPPGVRWEDVQDHIKISHGPLLVPRDDEPGYCGLYWAGTRAVLVEDLGPEHDQAIEDFRDVLRERGHA
jgi:hypothetical protein